MEKCKAFTTTPILANIGRGEKVHFCGLEEHHVGPHVCTSITTGEEHTECGHRWIQT